MTEEDVAVEAALVAARILEQSRPRRVDFKGPINLVTEVDLACEAAIREVLGSHTPDIPVHGEEGGGGADAATRWVVDPLDGTTNFVHRVPHYAVSIALEVDRVATVGVVHDVCRRRTLRGTLGRGATCDGVELQVSEVSALDRALAATGFPYDRAERGAVYLSYVQRVLAACQGVRRAGSAALDLAWVAEGRLDVFWEFGLARWDVAAGIVLVGEAGGHVLAIPGYDLSGPVSMIATNGALRDMFLELIASTPGSETP